MMVMLEVVLATTVAVVVGVVAATVVLLGMVATAGAREVVRVGVRATKRLLSYSASSVVDA